MPPSPPFTDQETEVPRVLLTCLRLHSPKVIEKKFRLMSTQFQSPCCSEYILSMVLSRALPPFRSAVPNFFGTRDLFHGRQLFAMDGVGGDGSGGNASNGEQWGAAGEASLARPSLTF